MSSIRYFVEGECEEALIKAFMDDTKKSFKLGKVNILNFNNTLIPKSYVLSFSLKSEIVIVVDTDINNTEIIDKNVSMILKHSRLTEENIHIILSVETLEDEIVYSCSKLSKINDLFNTKSLSEFKKKFLSHKNLKDKLLESGFDIEKIWTRKGKPPFNKYKNDSIFIKK